MAVEKIEKPFQPLILPTGQASPVIQTIEAEYKNLIQNVYCSGSSRWDFLNLFKFDDFDPLQGYKYRLIGSGSFYVFPSVKDGSYLVGRKHFGVPLIEKQLKSQFILANSYSFDAFDLEKATVPGYFSALTEAMSINARDRLNFIAYLIFRGTGTGYQKNEYFEKIVSESYNVNNGSQNGFPIYSMTYDLKDATNPNFKVTQNALKTAIDAIRTQIKTNKVEIDTTDAELRKKILVKNVEINQDNKSYLKAAVMREQLNELLTKIELNPHLYAIKKDSVKDFRYVLDPKDLIIMANNKLSQNWRFAIRAGVDGDDGSFFGDAANIVGQILEAPYLPDDEILIFHKDAIQLVINGRYTKAWSAPYEDPQIMNFNNTVAIFMGVVEELPCVTLKFKP